MTTSWVIAIDFGTAYSGYCYCPRSNHSLISNPDWGGATLKTPTCILFNEDGKFLKFGYEALKEFKKMVPNKKRLFNHFKMQLYNNSQNLRGDMKIYDSEGKPMEAMKVFSESLRYLKDHALNLISKSLSGSTLSASDVSWVLTVPAIWEPAAKQFMREAAIQGGLVTERDSSKLIIALEPEAASVWCMQLSNDGFISEGLDSEKLEDKPGKQYIVVDCGGGTVDITVHQVTHDRRLKELHRASGNNMGGGSVDAKFKNLLRDTFGHGFWDPYEKKYPNEVQRMMIDFTTFKCCEEDEDVYIPGYNYLVTSAPKEICSVQGVMWQNGIFQISFSKLKELFRESVDKIVQDIRQILDTEGIHINYILLVGGYAASEILQKEVKKQFGGQCRVMCPMCAQLAVARGAVLYGLKPTIVASRVSALTYGIEEWSPFDQGNHKVEKKRENKTGVKYCADLFKRFVQKGQSVPCNEAVEYTFSPINSDQTAMTFEFYSTEYLNAKYVDEQGMKRSGQFTVKMPDKRGGLKREVKLEISFGLTEIQAIATDQTSNERESVRLDFMTKP